MLEELYNWVADIPPVQQPMRFGNTAFRTWHARLTEVRRSVPCLFGISLPTRPLELVICV